MFNITHGDNQPITSNISQKCQMFSLEIFKSMSWYFSRDLFKDLFHVLLIHSIFFHKTLNQLSMKLILTQREMRSYALEYSVRGFSTPKYVASIDLSFHFRGHLSHILGYIYIDGQ